MWDIVNYSTVAVNIFLNLLLPLRALFKKVKISTGLAQYRIVLEAYAGSLNYTLKWLEGKYRQWYFGISPEGFYVDKTSIIF